MNDNAAPPGSTETGIIPNGEGGERTARYGARIIGNAFTAQSRYQGWLAGMIEGAALQVEAVKKCAEQQLSSQPDDATAQKISNLTAVAEASLMEASLLVYPAEGVEIDR